MAAGERLSRYFFLASPGLHFLQSCESYEYCDNPRSQVVGTAWAMLALLLAKYPERAPILRGARLLMQRQLPDGNWAQEDISGVFNANCAISYSGYKNIFPIWALGLASRTYPDAKL
jgi:lanosterol synthase